MRYGTYGTSVQAVAKEAKNKKKGNTTRMTTTATAVAFFYYYTVLCLLLPTTTKTVAFPSIVIQRRPAHAIPTSRCHFCLNLVDDAARNVQGGWGLNRDIHIHIHIRKS
mmetsp:Transcript_44881/g.45486  ORF Transcript_44881/g.45486 Transcript_44881/m.45486 type:complete len:109 (-) Transcript_44881:270-596(-)